MNEDPNNHRRELPDLADVAELVWELAGHALEFVLDVLVTVSLSVFDF